MARDRFIQQSLGSFYLNVKKSRVLLVGAGGIGCELLKNLVLTGFGEIHIVDLDTIDLSNLNRQFLFRREHIKKAKALVAKESAAKFNPNVRIEAHHANIKDASFNIAWYKSFDIVFNALDNIDARRHVNRMCLVSDVPLIESGTTGYDGQVQVIKKGRTECYECNPKPTPKSFPVCTIRSTPSQPIHCIVWAKSYLFAEIFGTPEDDSVELDASEDSENAQELRNLQEEATALKDIRRSMDQSDFARRVFAKVFDQDIQRLLSMEDMWKTRKRPTPLNFEEVSGAAVSVSSPSSASQSVWSLPENYAVFSDSLKRLAHRYQAARKQADDAMLSFDKDDEDMIDFVAAAANMRSLVFGIKGKSKFEVKQMAGNIIPAIATTNAMAAGLCVLQAFKIIRSQLDKAKMVFLERPGARTINSEPVRPPNPDCAVCSIAQSGIVIDPSRATLSDLVEDVLKSRLGYGDEISISRDDGLLYDPDFDENLSKKFSDLGLGSDNVLTVADEEDENPRVNLALTLTAKALPEDSKPIVLPQTPTIARKAKQNGAEAASQGTNGEATKRKRSLETDEPPGRKVKSKMAAPDDAILVPDEGAIVIGDE